MKVLFNTYPVAFHTPGGGEIQLLQYKKYLPANSVEVDLMNQWNPNFLSYDVVHYFSCLTGSNVFCEYIKKLGLPLFVSPNLWVTEETKHNYPYNDIKHQFHLADKVICNSDMECYTLAKTYGVETNKFATVYNGVDDGFFESVNPDKFRKHFNIDGNFILNVANVEPRKNQLNLIKAMKKHPDLKLVMIGHQRDPDYAKLCLLEGRDQVIYIEALPHDSNLLKSAYAACSVFALPSTLETPGLAALEAASMGAKILITSEGSTKEYFGEGATYVDWENADEIANSLTTLMSEDSDFLLSLFVRTNFGWDKGVKALAKLYENKYPAKVDSRAFHGLHSIESDGLGKFAWAKSYFSFSLYSGVLNFRWHSISNVTVDIIINGELKYEFVPVGADWSKMEIVIDSAQNMNHIEIKTNISSIEPHADPRELAFAIRSVKFFPEIK